MHVVQIQSDAAIQLSAKSATHKLVLALVWLTVALSSIVFTEPAPFDILMIGLIILLPIVGLVRINAPMLGFLLIWLIIGASGFVSAITAELMTNAVKHTSITLYLSIATFILIGFVAKNPSAHSRLMMNAYLIAAVIGSFAAIIGYFNLLPGFEKTFTLYGRARGTFKDPNVFGAFLVPAFIYCTHVWLKKPITSSLLPTLGLSLLSMGALLSFSRGAWAAIAIALIIYLYLTFVTSRRNSLRLKIILLCMFGAVFLSLFVSIAMQFDAISGLLSERASLDQSYDQGPEGRFGGQKKARDLIIINPLGIGAQNFGRIHHIEEAHNVYLSMFLNAGWIGGLAYLFIVLISIILGLRHALYKTSTQGIFIVILAAFTAIAAEGIIIDTDHWRHFFVLLALLWGIMLGENLKSRRTKTPANRYSTPYPAPE